jgi:hypothetical protein
MTSENGEMWCEMTPIMEEMYGIDGCTKETTMETIAAIRTYGEVVTGPDPWWRAVVALEKSQRLKFQFSGVYFLCWHLRCLGSVACLRFLRHHLVLPAYCRQEAFSCPLVCGKPNQDLFLYKHFHQLICSHAG